MKTIFVVIILASASLLGQENSNLVKGDSVKLTKVEITGDGIDQTAVCNDGSPASYGWKKSPTGSNKWLVMLQAGVSCWDEQTCKYNWDNRPKHLMSSKHMDQHFDELTGVYSPNKDENPLWDANKVFLFYCSSDSYTGLYGGKNEAKDHEGYKFRGQAIVEALIQHLIKYQGLGHHQDPELMVFGGISHGAVGAITHLDQVASTLEPYKVKTLGLLDSGLYLDPTIVDKQPSDFIQRIETTFHQQHDDPLTPGQCSKTLVQESQNQYQCLMPQYRLKYVKTPFIFLSDQFDDRHLGYSIGFHSRWDYLKPKMRHDVDYANKCRKFLQEYDIDKYGQNAIIMSTASGWHAQSVQKGFNNFKSQGNLTQKDVLVTGLNQFLKTGKLQNQKIIDVCQGTKCIDEKTANT